MKTAPEFDPLVGHSHQVNTKVTVHTADGTEIGELPVESGTITGDATRRVGRWAGSLTLAGLEWAPTDAADPLAGLVPHQVRVARAAQQYGEPETWVEVARLWVYETTVTMSRSEAVMQVELMSPAGLFESAITDRKSQPGETCQAMIGRIAGDFLPAGFLTVLDSSAPVPIPDDYDPDWPTVPQIMDELAEIANTRVFFDALGRLVIRPTLPALDAATLAPARQVAVDVDVTRYSLTMGRARFSNWVGVHHRWTDASDQDQFVESYQQIQSGPLTQSRNRMATLLSYDTPIRQAELDGYAQAVATSQKQAWVTSRLDAVQDPRIEPDDIVETTYMDRTLRHRVVGVQFDLRTDAMQLTGRTALPVPTS